VSICATTGAGMVQPVYT